MKVTLEAQLGLIGGTMGLLTGFSILSGVEIIYYLIRFSSFSFVETTFLSEILLYPRCLSFHPQVPCVSEGSFNREIWKSFQKEEWRMIWVYWHSNYTIFSKMQLWIYFCLCLLGHVMVIDLHKILNAIWYSPVSEFSIEIKLMYFVVWCYCEMCT